MDISPKALNTQDTIHRPHEAQEEGRPNCGCFGSSEKQNKILTRANIWIKCRAETEGKAIQSLSHLETHPMYSHQTPTLLWMPRNVCWKETFVMVSSGRHARALQIQRRMLIVNHWTECEVPNGGVRERTEVTEGVCNLIGRGTYQPIWNPRAPRD